MKRSSTSCCIWVVMCWMLLSPAVRAGDALIRYPNVHDQRVVFVARDRLWTVSIKGGTAEPVQGGLSDATTPRYSPDGQWLAFTARVDGIDNVYVLPARGGVAKRLTYSPDVSAHSPTWWGPDNLVVAWTPDSKFIVFLSRRGAFAPNVEQLFQVPIQGGLPTRVSLKDAKSLSFSSTGRQVAFTRTYTDFRPWKRYDGGLAPDIFTYDFSNGSLRQLTHWKGTDSFPMWAGSHIYFLSDRDASRRANIWEMDEDGKNPRQVTHFEDYDVDYPSLGDHVIAFQEGAKLWLLDTSSNQLSQVPVRVPDDGVPAASHEIALAPYIRAKDVTGNVDYALSPDGTTLALSAFGDIALISPASSRNITQTDSIDEDHPAWSYNGKVLAYESDRTGEQEIVLRDLSQTKETPLTHTRNGYYYTPVWSPNGQTLVVADANHGLWLLHANGADALRIANDPFAEIRDATFSPDGHWIAYSEERPNLQRAIHVFDTSNMQDSVVSNAMENDDMPHFSSDGKRLYFRSSRQAQPVLSDVETDMAAIKSQGIYEAPITQNGVDTPMAKALSLPPGNYELLGVHGSQVFYVQRATPTVGGHVAGEASSLNVYDLATSTSRELAKDIDSVYIAQNGTHAILYKGGKWQRLDMRSGALEEVDVSHLTANIFWPHVWREAFENAWRLQRDMYYNANMDGVNWNRVKESLEKYLPYVTSENDFDYLLSQLQGEVGTSHAYYSGAPSFGAQEHIALLGADLELDAATGLYRFARVFHGDNSRPLYRSPLQALGVGVQEGDYLIAIDGAPLRAPANPHALLIGKTDKVALTIAKSPSGATRTVSIRPLSQEVILREHDWVEHNRSLVDKLSKGRLGYVYLSNMEEQGTEEFIQQYYPQQDKEGMIFDIRWDNGGYTSQMILERLRRKLAGVYLNREDACSGLPDGVMAGPMAVIINHETASDGDQFAYFFRQYGLGPIVGTRSWGGVRGILGAWPLMNGATIFVPKDVLLTPSGKRIIEDKGTSPDIEVDAALTAGADPQLEAAVSTLLPKLSSLPQITCVAKTAKQTPVTK